MCRRLVFSVIVVWLLGGGSKESAAYLHVPEGDSYTVTGTETYDSFYVQGTLTIESGGSLTGESWSALDGPGAQIIVNGGSVLVYERFSVGVGSDGYITMNGGTFTVLGTFKFPDEPGGVHRIYLNDGIMHAGDIELKHDRDAVIYVGAGILRLDSIYGVDLDPQDWKNNGDLLPAEGYDEVVIEYIGAGGYTEVRAVRSNPDLAWDPSPRDGAEHVSHNVVLGWKSGDSATGHEVYLGTDLSSVDNATDPNVLPGRGRQSSNSYAPSGALELGETYYWRVDEVNDGHIESPWKGEVWSFTVDEGKAWNPEPFDGAWSVPLDKVLSWTPGIAAASHDMYFGTNFDDVDSANSSLPVGVSVYKGRQDLDANAYDPCGLLEFGRTYYWRVDEVNGPSTWKGGVWSFTAVDIYINSIGMTLVRIQPGSFMMGSENGDFDEEPIHKATVTGPFYMGTCEVTNAQYEQFDPDHSLIDHRGFSHGANEAVIFVSWEDASAFCDWLSQQEGQTYRLPTEAEWEYVCRAGTTTNYHTGDTLPAEYEKNAGEITGPEPVSLVVGQTPPNPWGLHDMHGNVEEWCYDWYGPYEAGDQTDPLGRVNGRFRVSRGGSHGTYAYYLRSANRMGTLPEDKHWLIGFRVVMGQMPATEPLPEPPPELYQTDVSQEVPPDIEEGPDPNVPYFEGPRTYVKVPPGSYGPLFSNHNHDPALTECPNGDLLAIWYTCVREQGRELAIAASRLRYGQDEWEQASPFWDAPDRNDHAPAMWTDESGKMYHFNGLGEAATWGALATILRTSTDNGVTWLQARLIVPEHDLRHMPVESVFRTSGGSIILPCDAVLDSNPRGTAIWVSEDNGQTWHDPGGTIAGIHAGVVELGDGRLLAFGRGGNIDGRMPKSISSDMGQTWTYSASEFPPISGGQRLVLRRLKEGPILFVSFTGSAGMIIDRQEVYGMFAAISYDEGETWSVKRLVTAGGPARWLDGGGNTGWFIMDDTHAEPRGYLAATQTPDGVIHLISSALHYRFNLAWLEFAHMVSRDPSPPNNAKDVPRDAVLSWRPGIAAASHDMYFGTNFDDVADGNSSLPVGVSVYKGRQDLDANAYDPCGLLEFGRTYYWRVDEVNEANTWKGDVWSFTAAEFIVVDDMESYDNSSNLIWDMWIDGAENGTGSWIMLGTVPADPVHGGEKSMWFDYDNRESYGGYSEAYRAIADPCDWTVFDVRALALYFYGDPGNDATEQMYVGLEDSRGAGSYAQTRYGDNGESMNDITEAQWHQWNLDLQDFNDGGVILTDVSRIYIGFGDRANPVPGGSGTVYFDDIRLYVRRCIPEFASPADFTDDCIVELSDFAILANQWLRPPGSPSADIAPEPPDGFIDTLDLAVLVDNWLTEKLWPLE